MPARGSCRSRARMHRYLMLRGMHATGSANARFYLLVFT